MCIEDIQENEWQPECRDEAIVKRDVQGHGFPGKKKYTFLDRDALLALPKLQWIIKHVLPARGVAAIYGPSGSGKSFLALDLGASICLGTDWFGKKCKQTSIVYLGLEGAAGLQNRVKAWEAGRGKKLPMNFTAVVGEFDLAKADDTQAIVKEAPKGSVLIIDTLNRASAGRDENSSSDMGIILASVKRIEQGIEGLVLLVHHTGKDHSKGLRGHSSLHAALDAEIVVKVDKHKLRTWEVGKLKDEKDHDSFGFRLEQRIIGTDEDGEPETSCTVEPEESIPKPRQKPNGIQQRPAFDALKRLIESSPINGLAGAPSNTRCVSIDSAVTEIAGTLSTVEKGKRKNRAKTLIDSMINGGFLMSGIDSETGDSWYWLPDR